ncbi:MAG TPA: class D sortase [Gemmatimonadales bacterium]|jgi:sortase A
MSKRRTAGLALFVSGGLLLSFAGGEYALGAATQYDAREAWNDAGAAFAAAASAADADPSVPLIAGAPVARLLVPKIGLDEIVLEGVSDDVLNGGPGHMPGTPLPGATGNAVISAHRDRHFRNFGDLGVGDTVETQVGYRTNRWVVVSKRVVDKDAAALFRSQDERLTLTTCWPIRYLGTAPDRLILTAKPVTAVTARKG